MVDYCTINYAAMTESVPIFEQLGCYNVDSFLKAIQEKSKTAKLPPGISPDTPAAWAMVGWLMFQGLATNALREFKKKNKRYK